ncbi:hypothetical protein Q8A73_016441 [Channa argus]|nr:hypothetical protein Q8A73_016441 [Channa argus]
MSVSFSVDGIIFLNGISSTLPSYNHHALSVTCAAIQKLEKGTHGQRRQREGYDGRFSAALHPLMVLVSLLEVQHCRESPSPSPPRKSPTFIRTDKPKCPGKAGPQGRRRKVEGGAILSNRHLKINGRSEHSPPSVPETESRIFFHGSPRLASTLLSSLRQNYRCPLEVRQYELEPLRSSRLLSKPVIPPNQSAEEALMTKSPKALHE